MINYLTLDQLLLVHQELIDRYGGSAAILDMGKLESALAQPRMTFGGVDLYPTVQEKAAALSFSVTCNHGFQDGNKRAGLGALDLFLRLNSLKLSATTDEIHSTFLALSDSKMTREQFSEWVRQHIVSAS